MFHREQVIAALEAKADRFVGYETELSDTIAGYEQALAELAGLNRAEIEARLAGVPWHGARPTVEHDQHPGIVVPFDPAHRHEYSRWQDRPFGQTWANHEQARAWARDVLTGVPTVAVDGSQITPSKDISVPVGAVLSQFLLRPCPKRLDSDALGDVARLAEDSFCALKINQPGADVNRDMPSVLCY